jgi:hypothetical protein
MEERRLGFLFGVLAGVFLFIEALITFILGVAGLVLRGFSAHLVLGTISGVVLATVLGLLFVFFSIVGSRRPRDFSLAGGVILIVLSIGTWYLLGLGLLNALAGILGLVAGILFVLLRH